MPRRPVRISKEDKRDIKEKLNERHEKAAETGAYLNKSPEIIANEIGSCVGYLLDKIDVQKENIDKLEVRLADKNAEISNKNVKITDLVVEIEDITDTAKKNMDRLRSKNKNLKKQVDKFKALKSMLKDDDDDEDDDDVKYPADARHKDIVKITSRCVKCGLKLDDKSNCRDCDDDGGRNEQLSDDDESELNADDYEED